MAKSIYANSLDAYKGSSTRYSKRIYRNICYKQQWHIINNKVATDAQIKN